MPNVAVLPYYRVGCTPLPLEIMRIYNAGSSVFAACYSDAGGTTPMGNSVAVPIQADGNGLFPVVFVPIAAAYDIKFYRADGFPRDTYEGIKPGGGGGAGGADTYKVMQSDTDLVPGFLGIKLRPGAGMAFNVTIDPDLGEILSVSLVNPFIPLAIPANRIAIGTGAGVGSDALLTYSNKVLAAAAAHLETWYLGAGSYACFTNGEVRATPGRNFAMGVAQYATGDIHIGADGDYAALKLIAATKVIRTAMDTKFEIGGKFTPPTLEISDPTYQLPEMLPGEMRVIRFTGATGCTVTASATQVPRYRSTATGESIVGTLSGQIDAAGVFGIVAGTKVASITLTCASDDAVQVLY